MACVKRSIVSGNAERISYLDERRGEEEKKKGLCHVEKSKNQRVRADMWRLPSTPRCSSPGPLLENDYPAGLRTF